MIYTLTYQYNNDIQYTNNNENIKYYYFLYEYLNCKELSSIRLAMVQNQIHVTFKVSNDGSLPNWTQCQFWALSVT